jgi:[ribosomal protein S5]-alanine N-acetyltransferase
MPGSPPPGELPDLTELELTIATARTVLRPIEPRHADELFEHASDPEVARMMSWHAHADRAETAEYVERCIADRLRQTDLVWAIEHAGKAIGTVGFGGIKWTFRAWRIDRAELGYWIGRPFWGRGIVSEVAAAVATWGFGTLGLHKITIGCIDGNVASQRIIEKLGFRFLALFPDDVWRDGRWWDHRRYELTAAEPRMESAGPGPADSDAASRTQRFSRPRPL